MDFYYDRKSRSSIDRESGIVVRPSGRFSGDAGTRYFLIDPNSTAKTYDGVGIFEFSADYIVERSEHIGDNDAKITSFVTLGMKVFGFESSFSGYMPDEVNRIQNIKNIVASALLAEMHDDSPEHEFQIEFR